MTSESPTITMMDGESFRAARKAMGYSQADIGKLCGRVHHTTVSAWESGKNELPLHAVNTLNLISLFPKVRLLLELEYLTE